ncbi:MAG TPA: hypothetical protein VIO33_03585 [Burkholderiaceae bacterium]
MSSNGTTTSSSPSSSDGARGADSPIASRSEFHAALRSALAEAAAHGCRELWLCDRDFADWPLGERVVVESFAQWAGSHRRLTLIACHFDEVVRRHARWVEWRRTWSHIVHCRSNTELEGSEMPSVLLASDLLSVSLVDPVRYRGRASHDASHASRCREMIDAVLQRSEEAFPVTTAGI